MGEGSWWTSGVSWDAVESMAQTSTTREEPVREKKERISVTPEVERQWREDVGRGQLLMRCIEALCANQTVSKGVRNRLTGWQSRAGGIRQAMEDSASQDSSELEKRVKSLLGDAKDIGRLVGRELRKNVDETWPDKIGESMGRVANIETALDMQLTTEQRAVLENKVISSLVETGSEPNEDTVFNLIEEVTR